ncbi:hypothetical protein VIN30_09815 [Adlercreutzia sp. R7]|uniref:Pilus assembly protein TadE n=1 Tax=Adlercreutzia wanghongyangiae TaxID=3111451 RepID=A0ABU6IJX7_9ACTN|nr:hypothetical protein [Adlercreutzia sp. R7]
MGVGAFGWRDRRRGEAGQATVELAVAVPVIIIVAVIAVNALTFFGTCASFDRVARQTICALGAAPNAGEDAAAVAEAVEAALADAMAGTSATVDVRVEGGDLGLMRYTARLEYAPTLFGLGLRSQVLGVSLPPLVHEVELVVDAYKPGILF